MKFRRGQVIKSTHSTFMILEVIHEDIPRNPSTHLMKVLPLQSKIVPLGEAIKFRIGRAASWQVLSDISPEAIS